MIDQRIVDHYWQQAMQHKSIVVFDGDGLRHEFYLNQKDFELFPVLKGAVCIILWEENGEVKLEIDHE
jgi:hypothetical protein